MATVPPRTARPRTSKTRKRTVTESSIAVPEQPPAEAAVLTAVSINKTFRDDDRLRKAFADNLKQRSADLKKERAAAKAAFKPFDPSRFSVDDRKQLGYLPPGGDPQKTLAKIIEEDVSALSESKVNRRLALRATKDVKALIEPVAGAKEGLVGRIKLDALDALLQSKLTNHLYRPQEIYTACESEVEAARRMAEIDGISNDDTEDDDDDENDVDAPKAYKDAAALAKEHVSIQMATVTSPESRLAFNVEKRADQKNAQQHIDTFEMRDGASDVTAFHDFSSLQIAFRHVWSEIFDGQLTEMGEELYANYVRLSSMTYKDPRYDTIKSVDELKGLLAEVKNLLTNTRVFTPVDLKGRMGDLGGVWGLVNRTAGLVTGLTSGTVGGAGTTNIKGETGTTTATAPEPEENSRLFTLLESLEKILAHPYSFHVFAPRSINFGILVTYRQKWEPKKYQVGELVSTIPLAPKEVRRYTTRRVTKKTRNIKELEDALQTRRSEMADTARVDEEIIEKAVNKDTFTLTAHGSYGDKGYSVDATQTSVSDATTDSTKTKKEFRESVLKSAQEYRQQNRLEIDTSESTESEETTFHEIQNPNDELTVTYLFYELQRQYEISERLYKLTPVIFVANEVPRPDAITDAWLMQYDWILRRVILDDSFRPAMEYLTKGFVGAELNIRILRDNAAAQKQVVDRINQQIQQQIQILEADEKAVVDALANVNLAKVSKGALDTVKRIFDPIGITGETDDAPVEAAETTVDYAKDTLDRSMREKARLLSELNVAVTALQAAVDKLSSAVKEHYERVTEIDRLRVHIKENILYYMQAIWSHEPPDQRFFRIYNIPVPDIAPVGANVNVDVYENPKNPVLPGAEMSASLPMPKVKLSGKTLVEIADIDNLLGFKGNYMIFPLKKNNYVTLHMMQDYLELTDQIALRDPDEFGNYTLDDLQRFATCLRKSDKTLYEDNRETIRQAIIKRLTSGRKDSELVVVPTSSLYIEALVGTHPLLEDFKLIHRALDVKKVQADVRHAELENVRLAARALRGKDDDPDVERKIVIEGGTTGVSVLPDNGG